MSPHADPPLARMRDDRRSHRHSRPDRPIDPRRSPSEPASRGPALGSHFPAGYRPVPRGGVSPSRGAGSHRRARVPGMQKSPARQELSQNSSAATAGDLTVASMKARNPAINPFQINGLTRAGRYFRRPSAAAKVSAYSRETPPKRPPSNGSARRRRSNHKHLDRAVP
jgi:hypothetical protein